MPLLALACLILFGAVALGWRMRVQFLRTGDIGYRPLGRSPRGFLAVLTAVTGTLLVILATLSALWNPWWPIAQLQRPEIYAVGFLLFLAGFLLLLRAQHDMGDSWRVGVEETERTQLISHGVFRYVRNPIFTGWTASFLGIALMLPTVLSFLGVILLAFGLVGQVRFVEEPYLRRTHGPEYEKYAARVGRFLPGIGRL